MLQCADNEGKDCLQAVAHAVSTSPYSYSPLTALLACGLSQEEAESLAGRYRVFDDGKEESIKI